MAEFYKTIVNKIRYAPFNLDYDKIDCYLSGKPQWYISRCYGNKYQEIEKERTRRISERKARILERRKKRMCPAELEALAKQEQAAKDASAKRKQRLEAFIDHARVCGEFLTRMNKDDGFVSFLDSRFTKLELAKKQEAQSRWERMERRLEARANSDANFRKKLKRYADKNPHDPSVRMLGAATNPYIMRYGDGLDSLSTSSTSSDSSSDSESESDLSDSELSSSEDERCKYHRREDRRQRRHTERAALPALPAPPLASSSSTPSVSAPPPQQDDDDDYDTGSSEGDDDEALEAADSASPPAQVSTGAPSAQ